MTSGAELDEVEAAKARVTAAGAAYAASDSLADLDAYIEAYVGLVAVLDTEESTHGVAVMDLCTLRGVRWTRTRTERDWDEAVADVVSWRERIPPPDWRASLYVLAHGLLMYRRADATDSVEDIGRAIDVLEAARAKVRPGSPIDGTSSAHLANLRMRRYRLTEEPVDLEAAVQDALGVLGSQRARPEETFTAAKWLADALLTRAELVHSDYDIAGAIEAARMALERTDDPDERGGLEGLLGSALRQRFARTGDPADLDASISAYEASLRAPGLPPHVEAARLDNLGNGLGDRYARTHEPADLDAAIDCCRRALALFPAGTPGVGRACANLALSLIAKGRDDVDTAAIEDALSVLRTGIELPDNSDEIVGRLHSALTMAFRTLDVLNRTSDHLDEEIAAGERAFSAALAGSADDPISYRLSARARGGAVTRRLVAALLRRAALNGASRSSDLRRAFAIGESGKVVLLTQELLRRSLPAPAGANEGAVDWERQLLAELSALDAHELVADPAVSRARALHRIARRKTVRDALEQSWEELALAGPEAMRYVTLRRNLEAALLEALEQAPPSFELLSLLDTEDLDPVVGWQRGLCLFALRSGGAVPELVFNVARTPLGPASERLASELIEDRGRGAAPETWWTELAQLIGGKELSAGSTVVVSPVAAGLDLPWGLLLERSGFRSADAAALPVVVVPSLALLAAGTGRVEGWHEVLNIAEHFGIPDEEGVADGIRLTIRVPTEPSTGPLVVGNPTGDLDSASGEARQVARILGVEPLIDDAATVEAVRSGFSTASLVHVAAHAHFESDDPLDSYVSLVDGELRGRDLVGAWNTAEHVVLSACESGSGRTVTGGEVAGFAAALLRSGVRTVVASLWRVDDAATAYLMRLFYTELIERGAPAPVALARAARVVRTQPGWQPPYYWAGFVVAQRGWAAPTRPSFRTQRVDS